MNPQQASFLDGIRISIEMIDIAYTRLVHDLLEIRIDDDRILMNEGSTASLFLDTWSMVDSAFRLRELIQQMPGIKKSKAHSIKIFLQKTSTVEILRHIIQHLRNEIHDIAKKGWPVWGSLTWIRIEKFDDYCRHSCMVVPGRLIDGNHKAINPHGKKIRGLIDHITLTSKEIELPISDLFYSVVKLNEEMESILSRQFENLPTSGSDWCAMVRFEATKQDKANK